MQLLVPTYRMRCNTRSMFNVVLMIMRFHVLWCCIERIVHAEHYPVFCIKCTESRTKHSILMYEHRKLQIWFIGIPLILLCTLPAGNNDHLSTCSTMENQGTNLRHGFPFIKNIPINFQGCNTLRSVYPPSLNSPCHQHTHAENHHCLNAICGKELF